MLAAKHSCNPTFFSQQNQLVPSHVGGLFFAYRVNLTYVFSRDYDMFFLKKPGQRHKFHVT